MSPGICSLLLASAVAAAADGGVEGDTSLLAKIAYDHDNLVKAMDQGSWSLAMDRTVVSLPRTIFCGFKFIFRSLPIKRQVEDLVGATAGAATTTIVTNTLADTVEATIETSELTSRSISAPASARRKGRLPMGLTKIGKRTGTNRGRRRSPTRSRTGSQERHGRLASEFPRVCARPANTFHHSDPRDS